MNVMTFFPYEENLKTDENQKCDYIIAEILN